MLSALLGIAASLRRRMAGLSLIVLLGWPAAGQARFLDCGDIQQSGHDQIVVGDVGLAPGADRITLIRLRASLAQQLSDLAASPDGVYPVLCPGHEPRRGDYTRAIVLRRYAYGVLVELWGTVDALGEAGVTYAVLPLLLLPDDMVPGFYDVVYRIDRQRGIAGLFASPRELRAFTALAAGLHALAGAERDPSGVRYGRAYSILCKAAHLLGDARQHATAKPDNGTSEAIGPGPAAWSVLRDLAMKRAQAAARALHPPTGVRIDNCAVPPPDPSSPLSASLGTMTR
jgi:hypothetical protein